VRAEWTLAYRPVRVRTGRSGTTSSPGRGGSGGFSGSESGGGAGGTTPSRLVWSALTLGRTVVASASGGVAGVGRGDGRRNGIAGAVGLTGIGDGGAALVSAGGGKGDGVSVDVGESAIRGSSVVSSGSGARWRPRREPDPTGAVTTAPAQPVACSSRRTPARSHPPPRFP